MAVVRELWESRDQSPSGVTCRRARCSATARSSRPRWPLPANVQALSALPGFGHRMGRRQLEQWLAAVDRAKALPERELPQPGQPPAGPPPPRSWADKDPAAAARLSAARTAVSALAEGLNMPQENLITPDTVRRLCWEPPRGWGRRGGADARRATAPALADRAGHPALLTALARRPPDPSGPPEPPRHRPVAPSTGADAARSETQTEPPPRPGLRLPGRRPGSHVIRLV